MFSKITIYTIVVRTIIVCINFFLVVFSSQIWGDEARGIIALIMADVSLIIILNNISSGSTLSFHASKVKKNIIFSLSIPAVLITSFVGAIVFSSIHGFNHFYIMFIVALFISYANSISLYWLGKKYIKKYNLYSLSSSFFIIIFLFFIFYFLKIKNLEVYFYAYYLSYGIITVIGFYSLFKSDKFRFNFDIKLSKKILTYGLKNEMNYFIQFLGSRLSYFFISSWLGFAFLGLFSVAVAISEAIWIISKSISTVLYSNIINTEDAFLRIKMTEKAAFNSFILSLFAIIILYFVPDTFFSFVFGDSFVGVKRLIVYLFPGVLAVSVSKIYVHYFSGIGKMKVIIVKSTINLIMTLLFVVLLLKRFELIGACVILDIAYITSSIYLFIMFYIEKRTVYRH